MKKRLILVLILGIQILGFWGCKKSDASAEPETNSSTDLTGKILYEAPTDGIHLFNTGTQLDQKLFEGSYPERLNSGSIIYVLDYPNRLMISNEDGTSKNTLVENKNMYFQCPQASYDGKLIAVHNLFSSSINQVTPCTIVYKNDGTLVTTLNNLFHPSWTPDGRLVMSGSYANLYGPQTTLQEGIFITDNIFGSLKRIDPNLSKPMMPSVSPDGKQIAFVLNSHIWIMNIDGSGLRQLTKSSSDEKYPAWTPDGKYILFNYYRGASVMAIVPSDKETTITDETECFIFTKDSHFVNSSSQMNNW